MSEFEFDLGDEVTCRITGFRGVVVARTEWFYGCRRITVQPTALKNNGMFPPAETFDEEQLKLVKRAKVAPSLKRTGGPCADAVALRRARQ